LPLLLLRYSRRRHPPCKTQAAVSVWAVMDDDRLIGLIAYLTAYHGGGFVNHTIGRDELLEVLQELRDWRSRSQHSQSADQSRAA
jgi:hypothetical protein